VASRASRDIERVLRTSVVPEKEDVNVSAQPNVVGEVPAIVIRIFVDHDLFTVPQPIIGKAIVFGCNAEIEAIEPETVPTAAREAEDMASPKAAGEPPVFPGAIKMEAGIITARVMADPLIIRVNVRGFRMA
jgi:hypothetical protein